MQQNEFLYSILIVLCICSLTIYIKMNIILLPITSATHKRHDELRLYRASVKIRPNLSRELMSRRA